MSIIKELTHEVLDNYKAEAHRALAGLTGVALSMAEKALEAFERAVRAHLAPKSESGDGS